LQVLTGWPATHPEEAFNHLFTENFSWLLRYVQQNSGNASDAEDIFQESLFAAWVNLKEGRFTGNKDQFNAYFRRICQNKWINQLNSAHRTKTSYRDDFNGIEPPAEESIADGQSNEESILLRKCFEGLGEKCKNVLGLFYYKQQPMSKIAELTGDTEDSIKTIKYRCMQRLRKLYLEKQSNG
jgi:RNA polymerase sigma factor (sigma-70 family)